MRGWAWGALLALVLAGALGAGTWPARGGWAAAPQPALAPAGRAEVAAPQPSGGEVQRLAGGDRFATSADAATRLWPGGADTVILATGFDYPDALAGAALAASRQAPMLLTARHRLPASVRRALTELSPQRVVLLGGDAVLSPRLAARVRALPGGPAVERISGATRFDTAAAAARAGGGLAGGAVAVASGSGFADALAAGSLAAGADPVPVVLAAGRRIPADISAADRVLLVGALPGEVRADAQAQAGATRRLAGSTRWATSRDVADVTLSERLSGDVPLVVATGQRFADALAAGAIAARSGAPLLLTPAGGPTERQAAWIAAHRERLTGAWIVGGANAITGSAAGAIASLLTGDGAGRTTIAGTLGGDAQLEGGCVWLQTPRQRYHVLWPDGWSAEAAPVALRDPAGEVVARAGDDLEVTGAPTDDAVTACQLAPVFAAEAVRTD